MIRPLHHTTRLSPVDVRACLEGCHERLLLEKPHILKEHFLPTKHASKASGVLKRLFLWHIWKAVISLCGTQQ